MNWQKYQRFIRQFILTPSKTFKHLAEIKKLTNYLIGLSLFYIGYGAFYYFLIPVRPQVVTKPAPTALAVAQSFDQINQIFHNWQIIFPLLSWIVGSGITFLLIRIFSKKGNFKLVLVSTGLVSVLTGVPVLLLSLLSVYSQMSVISLIINGFIIWAIYLEILAISIIFSVSKKKALFVKLLPILIVAAILIIFLVTIITKN